MEILFWILGIVLVSTLGYFFLICPRVLGTPDKKPFIGVHYAHRGLFDPNMSVPENSLAAMRMAVENGYGIEIDVQLTKDSVPVVFHDANLKRMCNVDGNVCDYTLSELRELKLGDSNQLIPTLKEVLLEVDGKVPLLIEYKMHIVDTKVCELCDEILVKYKGAYCIQSFHPLALKWYRKHRPEVLRGQLSKDFSKTKEKIHAAWVLTYLLSNCVTRPDFISYKHKDASNISRRICGKMGALSVAWTIRSQKDFKKAMTHFDLFVFDSCILENPK